MIEAAFDYIAMPKGQAPGGPVQASDGTWYIVVPAFMDLAQAIEWIEAQRRGRPVAPQELADARGWLSRRQGER